MQPGSSGSRIGRALFTLLALVSLLGLLAVLVGWTRSYFPEDMHAACVDGKLVLIFSRSDLTRYWASQPGKDASHPVPTAALWRRVQGGDFLGPRMYGTDATGRVRRRLNTPPVVSRRFGVEVATESLNGQDVGYKLMVVPLAYAAVLLAIVPLAWVGLRVRAWFRYRAPGLCRKCGYDVRESPERCPECGTPVVAP